MADTILDLITRVNLEPLNAGMQEAVAKVTASTGAMSSAFGKLDGATDASITGLKESLDSVGVKLDAVTEQISAAMSKIASSVARGSEEAGLELGELKARFAD